jgi:hypothetical protein
VLVPLAIAKATLLCTLAAVAGHAPAPALLALDPAPMSSPGHDT